MTSSSDRLEQRLSALEQAMADLDMRLQAIEAGAPPSVAAPATPLPWTPDAATVRFDVVGTLTLVGRTCVLFAGAYLLRALSESGTVGLASGVALAFAYAIALAVAAYAVAPRHALSATFYGACTVLIGFPLLWEATIRFGVLPPLFAAIALGFTSTLVLAVAWRRDLQGLAWIATIGACALASVLLVMTDAALAFASFLIALGVATLWLGYDRQWIGLRWLAAFFADLAVLALVMRALASPPRDAPAQVMGVQLLALVGYMGSIAVRTIVRRRNVLPFEVVQTAALLLACVGGAMLIAHQTGAGALMLGPAMLALAAACYGVAFIGPRHVTGVNYYFYTSLALIFALTGGDFTFDHTALSVFWASLALVAAACGRRYTRVTLVAHSLGYSVAAALASGLVAHSLMALFAPAGHPWHPLGAGAWIVLAALAWCCVMARAAPAATRVARGVHLLFAVLAVATSAGVIVVVLRWALVPDAGSSTLHAGAIATLRTTTLAGAAMVVAWLGRHTAANAFRALLYPVLACGALKLVVEDLRVSPPLLLFVAFAVYGAALILGPRLARARAAAPSAVVKPAA